MVAMRSFLDPLGRDALVRLCQLRDLRPARSNDQRRSLLAYSYRGDISALIADMYRYELVASLKTLVVTRSNNDFVVHRPGQYDLEKLRAIARQAVGGKLGKEWHLLDDQNARNRHTGSKSIASRDDQDEHSSDALSELVRGVADVWSRPRKISRLLRLAGLGVTQRLSTPRFRELVRKLYDSGIETSLGDEDVVILPDSANTPGLKAKLRLRLIGRDAATSSMQSEMLSVRFPIRGEKLTTGSIARRLGAGRETNELCIASAYYDLAWIRELVAKVGRSKFKSIKLIYNGLGGRRLDEQRAGLRSLIAEFGSCLEVRLVFVPGIFHTKLFMSSNVALIGSANATNAAFSVNEEILFAVDRCDASEYFNSVWKDAVDINDREQLDTRGAARSLVGFFRSGSIYFKPQAQIGYKYNPYAEWFRKLTLADRQRLVGGFQSEYAEPEQGVGAFSLRLAAGLSDGTEGDVQQRGRLSIKPYAVETTLGYWVPDFYVDEVDRRVSELGKAHRNLLRQRGEQLMALGDDGVLAKFTRYRNETDAFILERGLTPPDDRSMQDTLQQRQPILKFYDGVLRRLNSDAFLDRICNPLMRSGMPEIWDDEVAADEFIGSFFEYSSLDTAKRWLVPRQIMERLGDVGDSVNARRRRDNILKEHPWHRNEWRKTSHSDLESEAEVDAH